MSGRPKHPAPQPGSQSALLAEQIQEYRGLAGDVSAEMRRARAAVAELTALLNRIEVKKEMLNGVVRDAIKQTVETELARLHSETSAAIEMTANRHDKHMEQMWQGVRDHESRLLGCEDAPALIDQIAALVAKTIGARVDRRAEDLTRSIKNAHKRGIHVTRIDGHNTTSAGVITPDELLMDIPPKALTSIRKTPAGLRRIGGLCVSGYQVMVDSCGGGCGFR